MHGGYIRLWRKIEDWEWSDDDAVFRFFVRLIMHVNWEDKKWHGIIIPRGSMVSSLSHLSQMCHKSQRRTRTMLSKLKSTGEITSKSTNKYTIYTIVKYDEFQSNEEKSTSKLANKASFERHSKDIPSTTTKELEELKELEERRKPPISPRGFEEFWNEYPNKKAKTKALQTWNRLNIGNGQLETIMKALKLQKESDQWTKDGGQFIPHPSTWLNQKRWEDEPVQPLQPSDPLKKWAMEEDRKAGRL